MDCEERLLHQALMIKDARPEAHVWVYRNTIKALPWFSSVRAILTDPVYSGIYHGTQRHPDDLPAVLDRAKSVGCSKMIVTGSDLAESRKAIELARKFPGVLYATVGVHPCSCLQFTKHESTSDIFLAQLKALALSAKESGHAVAFGEIGLDYDRLYLCPKDIQLEFFAKQLDVAVEVQMPLFLHSRAAHGDFVRSLKEREDSLPKRGVVHSFTGTMEEMKELVEMGWDIGVNGCSLKTVENCEVVKQIPLERLQLETDGPWCEIRASHASSECLHDFKEEGKWKWVKKEKWEQGALVKGRNESVLIGKVAWVVAKLKHVSLEVVCEAAWGNSVRMFGLGEGGKVGE